MSILALEAASELKVAEEPTEDPATQQQDMEALLSDPSSVSGFNFIEVLPESLNQLKKIDFSRLIRNARENLSISRRALGLFAVAAIFLVLAGSAIYIAHPDNTATARANSEPTTFEITSQLAVNSDNSNNQNSVALPTYQVIGGDTLFKIAQENGVTLADILKVNPDILDPDLIRVGQTIMIPDVDSQQQQIATPLAEITPTQPIQPTNEPQTPSQITQSTEVAAPIVINTHNLEPRFTGILQHPNVITLLRSYASKYMVDINGFAEVVQSTVDYYSSEDPVELWAELFGSYPETLDGIGRLLQSGTDPNVILVRRQ